MTSNYHWRHRRTPKRTGTDPEQITAALAFMDPESPQSDGLNVHSSRQPSLALEMGAKGNKNNPPKEMCVTAGETAQNAHAEAAMNLRLSDRAAGARPDGCSGASIVTRRRDGDHSALEQEPAALNLKGADYKSVNPHRGNSLANSQVPGGGDGESHQTRQELQMINSSTDRDQVEHKPLTNRPRIEHDLRAKQPTKRSCHE